MVIDKAAKGSLLKYTKDGALIEGVTVGGDVLIVQMDVEWIRDICPYFAPTIILVVSHVFLFYSGNLLAPVWLMFLGSFISAIWGGPGDNRNMSDKNKVAWAND